MKKRFFTLGLGTVALLISGAATVSADDFDDVDLEQIRKEFVSMGSTQAPEKFDEKDSFARDEARLEQEELRLLRELEVEENFQEVAKPSSTEDTVAAAKDIAPEASAFSEDARAGLALPSSANDEGEMALKREAEASKKKASSLNKKVGSLQGKLRTSQSKLSKLQKENSELKLRLSFAEQELERVSRQLKSQNQSQLRKIRGLPEIPGVQRKAVQKYYADVDKPSKKAAPTIATVTVSSANLRSGPGLGNSPLMQVKKGTRLLVETRKGTWYRVVAPSGARAWISTDVIQFGPKRYDSPHGTVQIGGAR